MKSLHQIAGDIQEAISKVDDEYVHSLLDFLEINKNAKQRAGEPEDFGMVSWLGFPMFEADFGWGRPWFIGPASMGPFSYAYVIPGAESSGGVSISLSFEQDNIARFKEIFYKGLEFQV